MSISVVGRFWWLAIPALEEITPQPHSLTGLELELLKPLKEAPKVPVAWSPERPISKASLGAALAALVPALQGYAAEG